MSIVKRTKHYDDEVRKLIDVDEDGLKKKHQDMADTIEKFIRATYFDWVELFPEHCSEEAKAPVVLGIGDVHVQQFTTYRDAEGRLIWGIADFDEVADVSFTSDLVRLATSANITITENDLEIKLSTACKAIQRGYMAALACGGKPIVLAEEQYSLRAMALEFVRDPDAFWQKLESLEIAKPPSEVLKLLKSAISRAGSDLKIVSRWNAGEGSLGRQRFVALVELLGGRIAREAKSKLPPASVIMNGGTYHCRIDELRNRAVHCRDPYLEVTDKWIVRRLSPDNIRIELTALPSASAQEKLLEAKGFEIGNWHLGTPKKKDEILHDLSKRSHDWLESAALVMYDVTKKRFKEWREHMNG